MLEKQIERAFVSKVKDLGGMALKFVSPGMAGVPDRLVLMPGGKMAFVELKANGGKLSVLQMKRKSQLEELGFLVYVIDDVKKIGGFLDEIK